MNEPSVGRTVHFVHAGVHYAAIVTWVWSRTCVNLFVFPNGVTLPDPDAPRTTQVIQGFGYLRTSVQYADPAAAAPLAGHVASYPDSWHWPERVEQKTDHELAVAAAREAQL